MNLFTQTTLFHEALSSFVVKAHTFREREHIAQETEEAAKEEEEEKYKEYLSKCDNVVPFIKIAQIFITFIPYNICS